MIVQQDYVTSPIVYARMASRTIRVYVTQDGQADSVMKVCIFLI